MICGKLRIGQSGVKLFGESVELTRFNEIFNAVVTRSLREKCPYSELFWSAFSQSECAKMRARIPPNADTFYAVDGLKQSVKTISLRLLSVCFKRNRSSEIKFLFNLSRMLPKWPRNSFNT